MQKSLRRTLIFVSISLISFVIDQISKVLVESYMELNSSITILSDFLYITSVRNYGVVFGIGSQSSLIFWTVSFLGILIVLALMYYIYKNINTFSIVKLISYSLIFGGALGNSYDRFARGYVIDFIDFRGIWSFIFNGADLFINIAVILLLINSFIGYDD